VAVIAALSVALSACGDDKQRQDANEPEGEFPVAVNAAKFPTDQRLAQTSDLRLEIENTGSEQVPNLAAGPDGFLYLATDNIYGQPSPIVRLEPMME
jgi:hypothetical protein